MVFEIGQRISFLYEKGYGTIVSMNAGKAVINDEDGFDRICLLSELVYIHQNQSDVDEKRFIPIEIESSETSHRIVPQRSGQKKAIVAWEIDLHIEEILESHVGMSNTDILLKQMTAFKSTFRKAKQSRVNLLTVIHGVGEGVLKSEIRSYLATQDQIESYDADFSEYGKGATSIEFHPNWT